MKLLIFLLSGCFVVDLVFAQENNTAFLPVEKTRALRSARMDSTADVANWALSRSRTDADKVRAIYSWVTANIRYDKTGAFALNAGLDKDAKIHVAFAERKGVCENFAAIFHDICKKAGIEAYIIEGYTRLNGFLQNGAHTWVTAKINDDWFFFDPTWDEGGRYNYFMVSPEEFIQTHIPFDPLWKFLPESHQRFDYKDSLNAYLSLDSLQRWESAEKRISSSGTPNRHAESNLKVVKMNIEIERQGEQVNWYNQAIENLNQSIAILNGFIQYRNNLFLPAKTDGQLKAMLQEPEDKIGEALRLLTLTDESKATLVMGTWQVREKIAAFQSRLNVQKVFLNTYLRTPLTERENLFYSTGNSK